MSAAHAGKAASPALRLQEAVAILGRPGCAESHATFGSEPGANVGVVDDCAHNGTGAFAPEQPGKETAMPWNDDSRCLCNGPDDRPRVASDEERAVIEPTLPAQGRMGRLRAAKRGKHRMPSSTFLRRDANGGRFCPPAPPCSAGAAAGGAIRR